MPKRGFGLSFFDPNPRPLRESDVKRIAKEMAKPPVPVVLAPMHPDAIAIATRILKGRGFAAMTPERRAEISSKGGKAAHAKGTAHEWTLEEAREAGRKGGRRARA